MSAVAPFVGASLSSNEFVDADGIVPVWGRTDWAELISRCLVILPTCMHMLALVRRADLEVLPSLVTSYAT